MRNPIDLYKQAIPGLAFPHWFPPHAYDDFYIPSRRLTWMTSFLSLSPHQSRPDNILHSLILPPNSPRRPPICQSPPANLAWTASFVPSSCRQTHQDDHLSANLAWTTSFIPSSCRRTRQDDLPPSLISSPNSFGSPGPSSTKPTDTCKDCRPRL